MNKFDEIRSPLLQVYNRTIIFRNTYEDFGLAYAEEYLNQFNVVDRNNIALMYQLIKKKGSEYVIQMVRANTTFEEDIDEVREAV